ncbi:MAG TPA: ubiquinone/menaquinone biosynthesis methyltransferase [Candidatus Deferrimicrobiaceae bacterium]|jgi:demethylmenaquinone methyltransferase/2-methoxy-6-polyprenyl-1,4-benzoquinol methylase
MKGRPGSEIRDRLLVPERKKSYNEWHFSEAAPRYDLATRAMSLGRDAAWKRRLVGALPAWPSPSCADLACGTGDVTFLLAGRYPGGRVVGLDLAEPMLEVARRRNRHGNIRFTRQDMCATDFDGESLDIVTGSYALRNAPDLERAFDEIRRILKPGGVAAFLDFAKPGNPVLQALQHRLLSTWCGFWGYIFHRNPEIHGYIAQSLGMFPDRARLRELLSESGFDLVRSRLFYFGILELIVIRKRMEPGGGGSAAGSRS